MTTDPHNGTRNAPRARKPRKGPLLIAGVGLAVLASSGYLLTKRIDTYNRTHLGPLYRFITSDRTEFDFAGRPVSITDDLDSEGAGTLTLTYGDDALELPVQVPNPVALPGLDRHRDWFRLMIFAESTKLSHSQFAQGIENGSITPRLVAVTRNPMSDDVREGRFDMDVPDNWGWGEVMRDRWTFTFHEFLPAGGFESQTLRFPQSGASFYREQVNADLKGEPLPERRDDELREGTWQYEAALSLMVRPPAITMENQAMRAAGWTLPVASASVLVIIFSLAWAFAPDRVTANPADN